MVSAAMRRLLVGLTAVAAQLGWLQLAPAVGFPVTAPAAMLDRMLGAHNEAGLPGLVLLLLGEAIFAAVYLFLIEPRTRDPVAPFLYAAAGWIVTGALLMPLIAALQGTTASNDPMRATFFMLNLGVGAALEALIGWIIFGLVLAAPRDLALGRRTFMLAAGAGLVAAVIAIVTPGLIAGGDPGTVVEGRIDALPAGPVFISVLELPQPPGAVLGPHAHIPGFVLDLYGVATMVIKGDGTKEVGPGQAIFTAAGKLHDHENRSVVPIALAAALFLAVLAVAVPVMGARYGATLLGALLVVGAAAAVDPLFNHWYFIGVRPAAMRGALMQVPSAHRTYESENLTGLSAGPQVERLTQRVLAPNQSGHYAGPAAIVVLSGGATVTRAGRPATLTDRGGITIAGGEEANVSAGAGGARILVVEVAPTG
jgi:quercetin dioxygenase-like cupin family protein